MKIVIAFYFQVLLSLLLQQARMGDWELPRAPFILFSFLCPFLAERRLHNCFCQLRLEGSKEENAMKQALLCEWSGASELFNRICLG